MLGAFLLVFLWLAGVLFLFFLVIQNPVLGAVILIGLLLLGALDAAKRGRYDGSHDH